MYLMYFKLNSY